MGKLWHFPPTLMVAALFRFKASYKISFLFFIFYKAIYVYFFDSDVWHMLIYFIWCWQRVLEHCNDPNTQQIIMDEIMQSVCILAQDQYGNYVIQVFSFPFKPGSIIFVWFKWGPNYILRKNLIGYYIFGHYYWLYFFPWIRGILFMGSNYYVPIISDVFNLNLKMENAPQAGSVRM